MAAYAALVSLSNTIHRILNHNRLSISLEENQQLLSLLEYANSFEAFLEKFPDKFNILEVQMRELAYKAEDIIECFMLEQIASWPDYKTEDFISRMKVIGLPRHNDAMVGVEDYVLDIKDRLCGEPSKLQVISICGMAGTGKTTLARNIYHDPLIVENFVIRVWITISRNYSAHRILSSLLQCLTRFNTDGLGESNDEKVHDILKGKRYLVVIDDIWSTKVWDVVKKVFPDDSNGSFVMITTRLSYMASYPEPASRVYQMGLLSEDQSWNLLKQKVFYANEECPSEFEIIGKYIARRCKGWPLALVKIAGTLSRTARDRARWKYMAEDTLKYDLEKYFPSCNEFGKHELQLEKVMEEIGLVAGELREIKSSWSRNDVQRGADTSAALSSSSTSVPIHTNVMVGFEDYVLDLKDRLCGEPSKKLQVIPICGMGGIGKTTLARHVYDDPLIVYHFVVRAWVTISQDYSVVGIFSSLMQSLKEFDTGDLGKSNDGKVHKILMGRRYLVVMDDVWNSKAWDVVRRVFPDDGNGSRVMLTTRLFDVASYPEPSSKLYEMSLLNANESWNLLKQNVFGDEDCPFELQDIGKEIARSCKGLPLAIVVIAGLLSTAMRNLVSWKVIAENVKSTKHDHIEEILSLSYVQLPQYLRPCFLYMGSFPEDDEIHVKKLIKLWIAEGFIKSPTNYDSFERVAEECLEELVKRNLVFATEWKWDGRIKSCSLHDLMRDLSIRKAHESKFFLHLINRHIGKESFIENIRNQRRVSVDSSKLEFLSSLHGSTIRSIKCFRHDIGRLKFLKSVRLLRVLDAEPLGADLSTLVHLDELFHLRETILKMIPNLKKLQINCYEGLSYDGGACLDDLVHLHRLETLKIGGGEAKYYNITFPRMLKKLVLKWWKLPWYDIIVFGSLPNLQVLKLIGCACVGGTWETTEGAFPVLEVLKISGPSFDNWVTESSHFPRLRLLLVHDCEDLNGIPSDIGEIPTLQLIEVRGDVRKSLIDSVELIREEQEDLGNNTLQVVCTAESLPR